MDRDFTTRVSSDIPEEMFPQGQRDSSDSMTSLVSEAEVDQAQLAERAERRRFELDL